MATSCDGVVDQSDYLLFLGLFPGQALVCSLYETGGIRSCEIGSVMFGDAADMELVRLAIPRRTYTQSHIDYVIEAIFEAKEQAGKLPGYRSSAGASSLYGQVRSNHMIERTILRLFAIHNKRPGSNKRQHKSLLLRPDRYSRKTRQYPRPLAALSSSKASGYHRTATSKSATASTQVHDFRHRTSCSTDCETQPKELRSRL